MKTITKNVSVNRLANYRAEHLAPVYTEKLSNQALLKEHNPNLFKVYYIFWMPFLLLLE